ncbi:MAG: alpha/beta fold hydrolase [Anaerolineales bacterium]
MNEDKILHYQEAGRGKPVLLIHGFPFSNRMWKPQLQELGSQTRLIAPDLPGFGKTPIPSAPPSMDRYAQDCADLLDSLNITDPVILVGLSMGGYIALAFAGLFPERLRGLMLLSTRAGADSEEGKAGRDKTISQVRNSGTAELTDGLFAKLLAETTYEAKPEVTEELKEIMREITPEGVIGALAAMRDRSDSTEQLKQINVPTLIVHGQDDRLIPSSEAQVMAKEIRSNELHLIDNAGHLPNLEQTEEFNQIVRDFLAKF